VGLEARIGDTPAGYTIYTKVPLTDATWDVYWIVVDPAFQRKGVGRALLSAVEDDVRAKGGRWILIETAGKALYRPTHAFYLESGYREVSRIEDFYAPGDARIIFGKRP
jgi:ribosomal protein S18 acetylase RimI-like enzyme